MNPTTTWICLRAIFIHQECLEAFFSGEIAFSIHCTMITCLDDVSFILINVFACSRGFILDMEILEYPFSSWSFYIASTIPTPTAVTDSALEDRLSTVWAGFISQNAWAGTKRYDGFVANKFVIYYCQKWGNCIVYRRLLGHLLSKQ